MSSADKQKLAEFRAARETGEPTPLGEFLEGVAPENRIATLAELVAVEIELSWQNQDEQANSPRLLEAYVAEYPELATPPIVQKLLEHEFQIRQQFGDKPSYQDFEDRFPDIVDRLDFTFADPSAPLDVKDVSARPGPIEVGSIVDRFTIVREIGEGGMGSVYVAQQTRPVKREVALKVIRSGLNSKAVLARFDAERQALAMMDHPNIARILDGGTTAGGSPWFAMELVHGIPITDFCDVHRLGLRQRLQLFVDVCSAVQHAHSKGIIHRDLKPNNILVAESDGQYVPKVIDFGLAKALDSTKVLTDQSLATQVGQVVGTFKYMSPEQADADTDIDTRTDIYALGVVLYELLTGSTPLDRSTLKDQAMLKVLEQIRDHQPPRPSTRLSLLDKSATTVSELRRTDPATLTQILRGDLDWVVMKALEKERQRRYETASGFADDVQRYLDDEPVIARPPSTVYRLRKFVRKNRGLVASLATIATLLVAATIGTSWFAWQASESAKSELRQRKVAERKTAEAQKQERRAEEARKDAETSAKRSQNVLEIVVDSFRSTNPSEGASADMPAKDVLVNAQQSMADSDLDDLGKAEMLRTLTEAFVELGEYERASKTSGQHLEILESMENADPRVLTRAKLQQVNTLMGMGMLDEALERQRAIVEESREQFGPDDAMTLDALNLLGTVLFKKGEFEESLDIRQQVYDGRKQLYGEAHRETLRALGNLTINLQQNGSFDEAIRLKELVIEQLTQQLGSDDPVTLLEKNNLAATYAIVGRFDESFDLKKEVAELSLRRLGEGHPQTLKAISNLSLAYSRSRDYETAIELIENVVEIRQRTLGEEHPDTLTSMGNLGIFYDLAGRKEQALELQEGTLESKKKVFGPTHPTTLAEMANLAISYSNFDRLEDANRLYQQAYDIYVETLGPQNQATIRAAVNLAGNLTRLNRIDEATELYRSAVDNTTESLGETHPVTLSALKALANHYSTPEHLELAIEADARRFGVIFNRLPKKHPLRATALEDLDYRFNYSFAVLALLLTDDEFDRSRKITEQLLEMEYANESQLTMAAYWAQLTEFLAGDYKRAREILEPLAEALEKSATPFLLTDIRISIALCQTELEKIEQARQQLEQVMSQDQLGVLQRSRAEIGLADIESRQEHGKTAERQAIDAFAKIEKMFPEMHWGQSWLAITAAQRVARIVERGESDDQQREWKQKPDRMKRQLKSRLESGPRE